MIPTFCANCQGSWNDSAAVDCVRDEPCGPCVLVASLNTKIVEIEVLLQDLKQRRNVARTQVNRIHDPYIQQMPLELASHIFTLDNCEHKSSGAEHPRPLTLASVCKSWREIALSAPQVWTSLYVCRTGSEWDFPVQLAEQWLGRSGQLPLDIRLCWKYKTNDHSTRMSQRKPFMASEIEAIAKLICAHSNRWNTLDLDIPHGAYLFFRAISCVQVNSSLKNLKLKTCASTHADARFVPTNIILRPEQVQIHSILPKHVSIDWRNVVDLQTSSVTLTEALDVLRSCPQIRKLQLVISKSRRELPPPPPPLILGNLEFLRVQTDSSQSDCFFDFITAPELYHTLEYNRTYGCSDMKSLTSFLQRSACSLVRLKLECSSSGSLDEEGLTTLLYDLPSLTTLFLHSNTNEPVISNAGIFFQQFLAASSSSSVSASRAFLPNLKTFSYKARQGFSWRILASIYKIHSGPLRPAKSDQQSELEQSPEQHTPRPLILLHILTPEPTGDKDLIDKDSLLRFFDLPKHPMKVKLDEELMKASIKHHELTPDKDVYSFYRLPSSDTTDSE